jgi:hypothetical protein
MRDSSNLIAADRNWFLCYHNRVIEKKQKLLLSPEIVAYSLKNQDFIRKPSCFFLNEQIR